MYKFETRQDVENQFPVIKEFLSRSPTVVMEQLRSELESLVWHVTMLKDNSK